jgi:hypothetical protein
MPYARVLLWAMLLGFTGLGCGSASSPGPTDAAGADAAGADAGQGTTTHDVVGDANGSESSYALDGARCVPGVPRCDGEFGYQMCEPDGTWGSSRSCAGYSENGTSSYCVTTNADIGQPWAACVDPACWYWISRGFVPGPTPVGICTASGTIRRCNAGGALSEVTCNGVCTQVGMLDGRALGYCAPECDEGSRQCLGGPLYRECVEGRWLAEPKACAGGEACNPLGSGGKPEIQCGGDCQTGTSRCAADFASIEVCSSTGGWQPGQSCTLGSCRPNGAQAQCEAECTPGQHQCAYDGAGFERGCDDAHRWKSEAPCSTGTSCRMGGTRALGCVACAGDVGSGGNAFGLADSHCESGSPATCGADNAWAPPTPCEVGTACTELRRGASTLAYCRKP